MGEQRRHGRPHPSVATIRYAVRTCLHDLPAEGLVLVACSGGADSLALAEALAFEAGHTGRPSGAIVVDHGLQDDSATVAAKAAATCRRLGLDPVEVVTVEVPDTGHGLEADARQVRHAALTAAADRLGASAVLLGHTLDDQAEQVLLGLVRGSGARSLSGMPARRGIFRRPLLAVTREQTRAACAAEGIAVWEDPMNTDPVFTRVRARAAVADLERDLGPGVAAALARTAAQLRTDADLLDALAADARATLGPDGPHDVAALLDIPPALRTRVWRTLLIEAGAPPGQLGATHTDECDRLLTNWRGQGPLHLPGGLRVRRGEGGVRIEPAGPVE
ncbi:MAG TPA: tRNA lysidine(34) synthetase TilS [Intrasporangiaceae bacterium]|nr:tRNA lysidine(34) synthetase TilS [Intrasporangiaceae bacterium]